MKKYVMSGIAGAVVLGFFWCCGTDFSKRSIDLGMCYFMVVSAMAGVLFFPGWDDRA